MEDIDKRLKRVLKKESEKSSSDKYQAAIDFTKKFPDNSSSGYHISTKDTIGKHKDTNVMFGK